MELEKRLDEGLEIDIFFYLEYNPMRLFPGKFDNVIFLTPIMDKRWFLLK